MKNKELLIQMINSLNDDGIGLLSWLFGDFDKIEEYNNNTTNERIQEIRQNEIMEEKQRDIEKEKTAYENARKEYDRQIKFKASLTGKEKHLIEKIEKVNLGRYDMSCWELMLLANVYNNNLINGSMDIFRYGFMKGQKAEKEKIQNRIPKIA
jgi:hypothetical protein